MNLEREIAHDLLSIGAVFLRPDEPFTWASGIKSPGSVGLDQGKADPALRGPENGVL